MDNRTTLVAFVLSVTGLIAQPSRAQTDQTIFTDADASVAIICRNDRSEAACFTPLGGNNPDGDDKYVRVHDQNQLLSGYWHFDLRSVPAGATINSARFQLDAQTNSWGDTSVSVFAIVDESEDWDLDQLPEDQIIGPNAPKSDYDTFEWTGDPNFQQRFNSPTPFLDEGNGPNDETRELALSILVENQDPLTEDTNDYGGYAAEGGPGTDGSADNGDNIWPTKNAVDIDVTDLLRWKLGQNPGYSSITPSDTELTVLVRTEFGENGDNGFVRFISKESDFIGGPLDLAPGRLIINSEGGGGLTGDFNGNGELDGPDIDDLTGQSSRGANLPAYDLNSDALVDARDVQVWVKDLFHSWIGDADLNGEFNSSDLVTVLASGTYETALASVWTTGDFNGDGLTNSGDLVTALADGGYEIGPRAAVDAVPEPTSWVLVLLGTLTSVRWLRRRT